MIKTMLRKSILILGLLCSLSITGKSLAQISADFSGGVQVPLSLFGNIVKTGYGATVSGQYKINPGLAISLSAGYDKWEYQTSYNLNGRVVSVTRSNSFMYSLPVMIGPRILMRIPRSRFKPYLGIGLGIMFSSSTSSGSINRRDIIYSPYLGVRYSLIPGVMSFDLNVRESSYQQTLNGITNSWFGVNAGIALGM